MRLRLSGYGVYPRAGAPAVPMRLERIALPPEGAPVLTVTRIKFRSLSGQRLEPVPSGASPRRGKGEEKEPPVTIPAYADDPSLAESDALYPEAVAQLGRIGFVRDQRYVELVLTPMQVSPRSGAARIAEEIEIEITLENAATAPVPPPLADPRLDGFYRESFLNPEQVSPSRRARPMASSASLEGAAPPRLESGPLTAYRIGVKQEGMYRISCPTLGSCPIPEYIGQDPATFRLRNKGVEVPVRIVGGGDSSFDVGDSLEFYGQSESDPYAILNCGPPACPTPIYRASDFTDTNVYLLDAPGTAGRQRMASLDGTPGGLAAETSFIETAHAEVDNWFSPLNDQDTYTWAPTLFADGTTTASRDLSVPLPGLAAAAFTADVKVRWRGVSSQTAINPDHRTRVTVNGSGATTTTFDWDGETVFDQVGTASQSLLTDPTTLHVEAPAVPAIGVDSVRVDFAEITYRRLFQAVGDRLPFGFPNQAAKFTVAGLSGSPAFAYDVSRVLPGTANTREPRLVANASAGPGTLTFQVPLEGVPTPATRSFWVGGPGGYLAPDFVAVLAPNSLLDPANEADYIIIAHPSLIDTSPDSAYSQFVDHLQTQRGLAVRLVFIQEIYDAFSNSIEDPEAIRTFLAYAHDNWIGPAGTAAAPAYLLLVGDATLDPKNNLNSSDYIKLVPTTIMLYDQTVLKYHSSDAWLASFLGDDQSPDILFGRIPARTMASAEGVFAKLRAYDTAPPAGAWRAAGYFLADVGNVQQETDLFEGEEDAIAARFAPPFTGTKQYYARPPYNAPVGGTNNPNDPITQQFKADFVSRWNTAPPLIASFSGHGAFDILGNDLVLRPADVALLTNGPFQPFFYNSDCLTGGFHAVGVESIAEAFLESAGGGAIGYFAPSGLSFTFFAETVSDKLYSDLFGPEKVRELGPLTWRARDALFQSGAIADMQGFTFLGDPSLRLAMPAPAPPGSFTVSAGNAVVNLSWTVSPDPTAVGTNVYRATSPAGPYTKLGASPVAGTAYADTTVANGTTYFYRAASIDAGGFEGAVTNTNADCGVSGPPDGPQCRRARPANLVPPVAPLGVQVRDTGIGTTLEVSWQPNSETDLLKYEVSYGTVPGSHPITLNAGLATSIFLNGLTTGTTYYAVVRAINTSSVVGADSIEVSGMPHVFMGIAPPNTIQALTVTRSGNDLILSWPAVTQNIYGNATTINHYNVYRSNFPSFIPSDGFNLLAQVPASSNPSYTHTGGAVTPDDGYYLVSAVDNFGFSSGLGADLPAGILTLSVAPSPTPGMLRLSWPAVTVTVTGKPANISYYRLHGATIPVPRSAANAGNLIMDNLTGTSVDVPAPGSARFYYTVLVVDTRGNLSPY
ncbi:MAG TPA: C25 family cysteine peptidase [Candidatus Polarisedimenticolia bacterium]|nr:C25 family cysteine peptidase [Candidatus Polarisedimenticolia bacterium]